MRRLKVALFRVLSGVLIWLSLAGCGGGGVADGSPPPPPPPSSLALKTLAAFYGTNNPLNLNYAIAGQSSFMLLLNGTGFTNSSVVEWNGNSLPTMFGDSSNLTASVSSSLISIPGKAAVAIRGSEATSNSVVFPIASPAAATAGVIALITVAPNGSAANGDSLVAPSISASGRYVAFQSNATNLVSGPASGFQEIYERDTCIGVPSGCTPTTSRVTVTYNGSAVNGHSRDSAVSADGRFVAFDSSATNILPNSGDCSFSTGLACVFLRDTCIGAPSGCTPTTISISLDMNGAIVRGGDVASTPDGRFVLLGSPAPNVAPRETNGVGDLFIRDTCSGVASGCTPLMTLLSASFSGAARDGFSGPAAVSITGRYVVFQSWATNLVPGEMNVPGMFWRDTCIGATEPCEPTTMRADVGPGGLQPNHSVANLTIPAISGNGRIVAFGSNATNLISGNSCANAAGCGNIFVRDTCTGVLGNCTLGTSLISLANDGSIGNCFGGGSPGNQTNVGLSQNGRFVSFGSTSTNLTPDDTFPACGGEDIFVRDTCFGVASGCTPSTVRVSVANVLNPGTSANAISTGNSMSSDGHYVVFISTATNLLPGIAGNGHAMVYLAKTGF